MYSVRSKSGRVLRRFASQQAAEGYVRSLRGSQRSPMSATVAKRVRAFKGTDRTAHETVGEYVKRYMANVGLKARFPSLVVGMMPELNGWPVRNADGGGNIAYFSTRENAETSIVAWDQATRGEV